MSSPIDKLIEWYSSLPISHREDIAAMCGICCLGYETIDITSDPEEVTKQFIETVEKSKVNPYKEVATTISMRGFIQFFFIDKRSKKTHWENTEEILTKLAKDKSSEHFEKSSREIKFRSGQWFITCEKWDSLVSSYISDAHLEMFAP